MDVRILLAEDEENLLEAIKLNLEMEGYEVVTAKNGSDAIKKFEKQRFNLAILDVMMPEMNGIEVCQHIRITDTTIPILFLTARDSSHDKVNGLKVGADDYMTKPFNLEELLLRVKVLVKHSLKGTKSDQLHFGSISAKRTSLRSAANIASIESSLPARNKLIPSGASRIVPFNSSSILR